MGLTKEQKLEQAMAIMSKYRDLLTDEQVEYLYALCYYEFIIREEGGNEW